MLPGANGGAEWSPISVDPTLNYAFVAALHQPMNYIVHTAPWEKGRLWLGSAFVAIPGEEQYGLFSAVDLKTGKIAWQNKVPQPMMGGSLATAGGLTFTGEGNGNFNAYNSKTGKLLWQFNAGAGCNSAPMTFTHGRRAVHRGGVRRQLPDQLPARRRGDGLRPSGQGQEVAARDGRQGPRFGAPLPADSFGADRGESVVVGGPRGRRVPGGPRERRQVRTATGASSDGERLASLGPRGTDGVRGRVPGRRGLRPGRLGTGGRIPRALRGRRWRLLLSGTDGSGFPTARTSTSRRVNDYYWWENHRPLPIWYALLGGERIAHWSDE